MVCSIWVVGCLESRFLPRRSLILCLDVLQYRYQRANRQQAHGPPLAPCSSLHAVTVLYSLYCDGTILFVHGYLGGSMIKVGLAHDGAFDCLSSICRGILTEITRPSVFCCVPQESGKQQTAMRETVRPHLRVPCQTRRPAW